MMSPRLLQFIQAISLAGLAWFGYSLINRLHPLLVLLPILAAICNASVTWMLRYDRDRIAPLSSHPYLKSYLKWICDVTGEQLPLPQVATGVHTQFMLHSDADFRTASWRAKQVVFGHDEVIDQFLSSIRDALALRNRQRDGGDRPPLASFLLVGREGIGKRHLARVMAKLLFRDATVLSFECDKLGSNSLLGSRDNPGELLEAVRKQPCQLVLLEQIDAAVAGLVEQLQRVLLQGTCRDPSTARDVSFQNVIFVFTATKAADHLASLASKSLTARAWQEQAAAIVNSETAIRPAFLHALRDIIYCQQPSDYVSAQVTAHLMLRECQAHGLELLQADPLILASEVLQLDENSGFGRLPLNVKKLLSKPILTASQQNKNALSLYVRVPSGAS